MTLDTSAQSLEHELAEKTGARILPGNELALVLDGAVFDAMEELIARAERHVHLVMYIWRRGAASDRVVRALRERARAGVACRVLVDPLGTRTDFGEVANELREAGCDLRRFVAVPGRGDPLQRTHRKLLVTDRGEGLVGGWCIWDLFLGNGREREEWRDTNLRLRGPVARELDEAFARQWALAGDPIPDDERAREPETRGRVRAGFVASGGEDGRTAAEALAHLAIERARERLWISMGYFVPADAYRDALARRAREGVDVRVLAPGPIHDLPLVREAQRATYPELLRAGVRLFEYQPSMMHAKTIVVDDRLGVVGSINLEPMSLRGLYEDAVVFEDEELVRELASIMAADMAERSAPAHAPPRWRTWLGLAIRAGLRAAARFVHA